MGLKDILVFADGSLNGIARARMSAAFAQDYDAHVDLYVIAQMPVRPYGEGGGALMEMMEEARQVARDDAGKAVTAMRKFLPRESFEILTIEATSSEVAGSAAALARAADLVIVGRPMEEDQSRVDTEILNGVLFESGRPCLVIPRWNDARTFGKKVLVAYRGTREAARALHDALPILQRAEIVRLLVVDPRGDAHGEDPIGLGRMLSHLCRHGVTIETPLTRTAHGAPQDAISSALREFEADLLVMGGYGHSRLREFIFGGVTRAMLRECPTAMLLAH
jgi:nucleotide-binding universal stress UspA family protein